MMGRAKEYYYTLQGHLDKSLALIKADEASEKAVASGLEQLDRRKAELQDVQKRLKIEIRDRSNEVRRIREEMLALRNDSRVWTNEDDKGRNGA
jgi:prefoldin subunit 5